VTNFKTMIFEGVDAVVEFAALPFSVRLRRMHFL
jgi:hypothetical protein